MPTVEDALDYLGIDYADDAVRNNVSRALSAAAAALCGSVGADVLEYLPGDDRVKELVLIYTSDLYDERGIANQKVSSATRHIVQSMELQLRLELRRAKEAMA
jgi:hypothetical protein